MEIDGVTPSKAVQAVLDAMVEIAEEPRPVAVQVGLLPDTRPEGVPHGETATTESHASNPDARLDRGPESALVQASARPDTALPGATRAPDARHLAAPARAGSEFTLPADQLLNAAVIGLQVEPAFAWQLQRRGADPQPQEIPLPRHDGHAVPPVAREPAQESRRSGRHAGQDADHGADHDADDEAADPPAQSDAPAVPSLEPALAGTANDWPPAVSRALRLALGARPAPLALLAAAEQWRLARCVVLACPQGHDPAGPAWAFVLWPRRAPLPGAPLALFGVQVEARLHWSQLPPMQDWCHARVMKEQHPRQGRQLVALDAQGTATVACEVQLGPVPLRTPRWRHVCVRVDAVRPFWSALGQQWSVTVVVGARPLAGVAPAAKEPSWQT
jgi:hypothetical protein